MEGGVPFFFPSLAANFSWWGLEEDPKTFLPLPNFQINCSKFALPRSYNYPLMCENSLFFFICSSFFFFFLATIYLRPVKRP